MLPGARATFDAGGTAREGVGMLKRGCSVTKYGRSGKPHAVTFKLLEDEDTLTWKKEGMSIRDSLGGKKDEKRKVSLRSVSLLKIGRETAVFQRFQDPRASAGRVSKSNWMDDDEEDGVEDASARRRRSSGAKQPPGQMHL